MFCFLIILVCLFVLHSSKPSSSVFISKRNETDQKAYLHHLKTDATSKNCVYASNQICEAKMSIKLFIIIMDLCL